MMRALFVAVPRSRLQMDKLSAIVGEPPVPEAVFDQLLRAYMERARSSAWSAPIGTVLLAWLCWSDAVLIEVAERLHRTIRGSDAAARWGGEEFLIILKDTGLEAATYTAERLATAIRSTTMSVGPDRLTVTASFGVAELGPNEGLEQWLERADSACYRAKAAGRNQVAIG